PGWVESRLDHRAHVEELTFNPFTLRLDADDFSVDDKTGRRVLGFAHGTIDLAWRSLWRRGWVLDEASFADPELHVEISQDGRPNLAALLPAGEQAAPPQSQPTRFAIGHLALENGSIEFDDKRENYHNRIEKLSFELASLSTLEQQEGPYTLVAHI